MLKEQNIILAGHDEGKEVTIRELPALVADRYSREILRNLEVPPTGGVVALAMEHSAAALALLDRPLLKFVDCLDGFDKLKDIRDWRNYERLQLAALALHASFLIGRDAPQLPVTMLAELLMKGKTDVHVSFCSAPIAAVLESRYATYRELETDLSTEDVFNLCEVININAIRDWHATKRDIHD